jgi:hypothetical protein
MLENKKLKIGILLIATLIVTSGIYVILANVGMKNKGLAEANQDFSLLRPAFASDASIMATYLQQEAGMSIWLDATADNPLNLNNTQLKMANNLENVTSDYVIGSIPLPNFASDDYPHCFVHKSGWIIVYFLKINTQNSATTGWLGKMMKLDDSNYYVTGNLKGNILQKGLEIMCNGLTPNTPTTNAKYYHFQYPNAAKLMIVIKSALSPGTTTTFNIQVPSSLNIDERSWSFYTSYSGNCKIDTTTIYSGYKSGGLRAYGGTEITSVVLSPDVSHTVSVTADNYYGDWAAVCILILYH